MVRTNQGGSILSFVVLGGVMALLLIGGAYVVRHNLAPAENGPQVATTEEAEEGDSPGQAPENKPAPADKKDEAKETPKPQPNTIPGNADNSQSNGTRSPEVSTPVPAQPGSGQGTDGLPTTGPTDTLIGGVMLSCLVALLAAYSQSRRLSVSL